MLAFVLAVTLLFALRLFMKKFALPLLAAITVVSVIIAVLSYLRWAPSRPLVTVGGEVISKNDYRDALDKQSGKVVLNKLVYTALVRQAAQRALVMPEQKDVDARITELSRRNPQVATQAQDPITGKDFRDDLLTDIALENLRIKDITASDDEINAFYQRNQKLFVLPSQVQTTMVVTQYPADAATAENLLRQNTAPDVIARQPRLRVAGINGFNVNMGSLPADQRAQVGKVVMGMRAGQIKTLQVGKYYLTFKVKSAAPTVVPPLSQVRDEVARQVKLLKADPPQATIAALYQAAQPSFAVGKYAAFFSDVQQYNAQKKTAAAH